MGLYNVLTLSLSAILEPLYLPFQLCTVYGWLNLRSLLLRLFCTQTISAISAQNIALMHIISRGNFEWLATFIAAITSLGSGVALVIFLNAIDGEAITDWKGRITPDTIVNILTQISQGLASLVNGAVLFQLGMFWVRKQPRHLCDLDTIFRASHGTHASLQLCLTPRMMTAMTVPAVLIVLGLAMGPFAQNATTTMTRATAISDARNLQARIYNYTVDAKYPGVPDPGSGMKRAWENAWYGPVSRSDASILSLRPLCATGNCTFPEFQTLGALGKCVDLSPNITFVCSNATSHGQCTYRIVGTAVSLDDAQMSFQMSTDVNLGIIGDDLGVPQQFTNFDAIARLDNNTVVASKCVTYPAILTLNSSVVNGIPSETQSKPPIVNTTAHFDVDGLGASQYFSITTSSDAAAAADAEAFYLTNTSTIAIQNYGRSVFSGLANDSAALLPQLVLAAIQKGTLPARNSDMAAAMSLQFRLRDAHHSFVAGQSLRTLEYFRVRWAWLSLPLGIPVATFLSLLYTVVVARRRGQGKWRADAYTLIEMAPTDLSRVYLAAATGSSLVTFGADRTYFELVGGAGAAGRLRYLRCDGSVHCSGEDRVRRTARDTEGGLAQVVQAVQNDMVSDGGGS